MGRSPKYRVALLAVAGALCVASARAQVYKWVDEQGVTHYGERPPVAAGPSRKLDIALQGNDPTVRPPGCYTIRCQYERMRNDRLEREEEWRKEMLVRAQVAESMRPATTQRSADPGWQGGPVYATVPRRHAGVVRPQPPTMPHPPGPPPEPAVRIRSGR
ncbi:MAG: DUF4124 domain-containing protein [Burkholderiales bacterium]